MSDRLTVLETHGRQISASRSPAIIFRLQIRDVTNLVAAPKSGEVAELVRTIVAINNRSAGMIPSSLQKSTLFESNAQQLQRIDAETGIASRGSPGP